jgi:hypothetical protein
MLSNFRQIVNHFNNLKVEDVFNAPELAKKLNFQTKEIHGFLTPAKYMGIVIKGDITKPKRGPAAARMEYLKVRSLTSEEINTLSDRQDCIEFTGDLQRINKVPWEKVSGKDKVRKMIVAQNVTRLTDADISKICNVPKAFISRVRSDVAVDSSSTSLLTPVAKTVKVPVAKTVKTKERILTMSDDSKKGSYGRPMMKALAQKANDLGNKVKFHINEDGKYIINDGEQVIKPPSAAAACHFLMGMVSSARNLKV